MKKKLKENLKSAVFMIISCAITVFLLGNLFTYIEHGSNTNKLLPRFAKAQEIRYTVPLFYRLVCTGHGVITDYAYNKVDGNVYSIETGDADTGCPRILFLKESDIREIVHEPVH